MPQADPEPPDRPGGGRQRECVLAPRHGILDPPILAQGAVHPRERHFVDAERRVRGRIPSRHDVRDAEAKPVAVREPECRVVSEAGAHHRPLGDPRMDADVVLANAADGSAGQRLESDLLLREGLSVVQGGKAAV